jgi:hypothetical protein
MEKRQFDDPLVRPALVWLDQFPREKEWLDEFVNAGLIKDSLAEADFQAIQNLLEQLDGIKKRDWRAWASEQDKKLLFLFYCSGTMKFIDLDVLEYERINVLPLLFQEDGTFHHFVWVVLAKIREYAGVNKNFDKQYRRIIKKNRNGGPIEKRMPTYLLHNYPLELTAELEGLPAARLDRGILPMLYWGVDVYEAFYDIVNGDKKTMNYDRIPRWNKGGSACLPFLGYAAMKRDTGIIDAVFEGAGIVDRIHCLADVFYRYDKGRTGRFGNWIDKAIVRDFCKTEADFFNYRSCEGMEINPSEVQMAKVFLKYAGSIIRKDTSDEAVSAMRLFFANVMDGTEVLYLNRICGLEKAAKEYRQFVETIAGKAVSCEPELLFPPGPFANYTNSGTVGIICDFIEAYLDIIRLNRREDIIPFAKFICNALDTGFPLSRPLQWLDAHPRFATLIGSHIGDPDFLFRLLDIPAEVKAGADTKFGWINYFFSLWFLHTHEDKPHKTVWPARIQLNPPDQAEGPEEGSMLHKAAEILLSEGAIKKEVPLLDFIWSLFEEDEDKVVDYDFIPYKYFLRVNGDDGKDRAFLTLKFVTGNLKTELTVLRHLKTQGTFDAAGFILNCSSMKEFISLPPEFFDLHQLNRAEIFWLYLRERGNTFDRFEEIINAVIRPTGNEWSAEIDWEASDPYIAPYIDNAIGEGGDSYFELYKFLAIYYIAGESINRMLDEQPEKNRALLERAGKHLALIRGIEKKEIFPEEKRHCYLTSFCAAWFVLERGSPWKALKPFLLAFRNSRCVLLQENLRSNTMGMTDRTPADAIFRLLHYAPKDEEKLKLLRRDMANGISDFLKPLPSGDRGNPLDREQNYSDDEKRLEGFDIAYREPNPHWRYAYVRALDDLGVDADGKGHFFHSLLERVAEHDPSLVVRDAAGKTAERLRELREGWEEGSHRRHLMQAFWWLRRAHMLTLGSPINDKEALKTRNTEYR